MIEEHGKILAESNALIKKFDCDDEKDSPSLLKQKEAFNKLIDESAWWNISIKQKK